MSISNEQGGSGINPYLQLLRVKQWYKNLLLFIGLIFSGTLGVFRDWELSILGFASFCAVSSAVYIFNDILDKDRDKHHPRKKKRPIPSGRVTVATAQVIMVCLYLVAFALAYLMQNFTFLGIIILYVMMQVLYTTVLRDVFMLDILIIAFGFVFRAIAGAVVIAVTVSPWLIVCTFLLALFLAVAKRYHEFVLLGQDPGKHRKTLEKYTEKTLEHMLSVTIACAILAYTMYTFMSKNQWLMLTIPNVVYGLFRYMQLVHAKTHGGEPELIFKDHGMLANIMVWVVIIVCVLYNIPMRVLGFMGISFTL